MTRNDARRGPASDGKGASTPERDESEEANDRKETAEASAGAESEAGSEDASSSSKKERVLHTRVPAVLERELKRFAESLRVPVSNLVRAILEDAVSVADAATEGVEERLKRAARHLEEERERLKKKVHAELAGESSIFAYQPVRLAKDAKCARCKRVLRRGEAANLGLTEKAPPGNERVFVCEQCLQEA